MKLQPFYDLFRRNMLSVYWYRSVWDTASQPKHAFITNLAVQNGLATIDKLRQRGLQMINRCELCQAAEETGRHLFFTCSISRKVWGLVCSWMGVSQLNGTLRAVLNGLKRKNHGRNWTARRVRCALTTTVYELWRERNTRIFKGAANDVHQIVQKIILTTSFRMFYCKMGLTDLEIAEMLN